jgi:DNA (cytosine-5)-methyltransferase 1
MENVKWMMKKSNEIKNDFFDILWESYSISIVLLNAKDFWIPQNRERVFVIWSRLQDINAEQIIKDLIKEKDSSLNFKLKDALEWLPVLEPKTQKNNAHIENEKIWFKIKPYNYLNTEYETYLNDTKNYYLFNHINRFNNERDVEIFSRLPQWANSLHKSIVDIMPYNKRNHIFKDKYYKLNEVEVSKTITSHMKMDCNMYIHPTQSRWLSPRESARIQTFPDDYIFMWANNTWYAQIWNAVPVKLAEIIWKHIFKYLK